MTINVGLKEIDLETFRFEEIDLHLVHAPTEQLFGHVVLVKAYDIKLGLPGSYGPYEGTWALVDLRDEDRIVGVVTQSDKLRGALEAALTTQNLIYFSGRRDPTPYMPLGGSPTVDVYEAYEVNVYNFK